jgi:hypothetical protein
LIDVCQEALGYDPAWLNEKFRIVEVTSGLDDCWREMNVSGRVLHMLLFERVLMASDKHPDWISEGEVLATESELIGLRTVWGKCQTLVLQLPMSEGSGAQDKLSP